MSQARKIAYNHVTSASWGWSPSWFMPWASTVEGWTPYLDFDDGLIEAVKAFQREFGLDDDGLVGSMTFRRIWTFREANIEKINPTPGMGYEGGGILYNSQYYPIHWTKVVHWGEPGGYKLPNGCYTSMANANEPRKVHMGVTHWDVCLSSESCFNVLSKRGVSVHFGIDNDGTIYQWLDMDHIAWHASNRKVNEVSVGVEISNAFYPKYQKWYVDHGFGERPIVEGAKVHGGTLEPHLGFYPVQLKALRALWHAVSEIFSIPLDSPEHEGVIPDVANGHYRGFVHHYHVTRKKIDCAGVNLRSVLEA